MNKRTRDLFTDQDLLDGLKNRDAEVITAIYHRNIDLIISFVTQNSGSQEDAEDLFQDAVMILYDKITNEKLILSCSFQTFLFSICRNLWLQRLRKRVGTKIDILEVEEYVQLSDETTFELADPLEERKRIYLKYFGMLSSDCQKVLKLFAEGKSGREIAQIMQYKNDEYAKTKKYQCKENLKKRIVKDPLYNALTENEKE